VAARAVEIAVGLFVACELFASRIPVEGPADGTRDVGQMTDTDGTMADLDVGVRELAGADAVEPVLQMPAGLTARRIVASFAQLFGHIDLLSQPDTSVFQATFSVADQCSGGWSRSVVSTVRPARKRGTVFSADLFSADLFSAACVAFVTTDSTNNTAETNPHRFADQQRMPRLIPRAWNRNEESTDRFQGSLDD